VGPGDVAERLGSVLHERTGGNPLFVESVLDGWLEEGAVTRIDGAWRPARSVEELAAEVPEGIRTVVLGRLDQLAEREQLVLEAAAVAGVEFAVPVVAAAAELPDAEVERTCELLARRGGFLERRPPVTWPDGVAARYAFRHQVHQQVLYERVPDARRARLHRDVAGRLERAYRGDALEIATELAGHYQRGNVPERAVVCLRLSAERALRRLAPRLAIEQLQAALATLPALPEGVERERQELDLLSLLGQALIVAEGWASADAEAALQRARELGHLLADNEPIVPVLVALGAIYETRGDFRRAEELAAECLEAIPEGDGAQRLAAHEVLACSLFHQGSFTRALQQAELGAALAEATAGPGPEPVVLGDETIVACHDWAALALWFLGQPDSAVARAEEAIRVAQEPGRLYGLAAAYVQAAIVHQCRVDLAGTRVCAEQALELAGRHGYTYRAALAACLRGWARAAAGEPDGITELERGIESAHATGIHMDDAYLAGVRADALLRLGLHGDAAEIVAAALAGATQATFYDAELLRLRGLVELEQERPGAVETLRAALELARDQGARSLELRAAVSLARALAADGRATEALVLVNGVLDGFTEGADTADGAAARQLAAELDGRRGR
jgi:tetratricopeptide (TPR) repeat protein